MCHMNGFADIAHLVRILVRRPFSKCVKRSRRQIQKFEKSTQFLFVGEVPVLHVAKTWQLITPGEATTIWSSVFKC